MSPVSRGRKATKSKKKAVKRRGAAAPPLLLPNLATPGGQQDADDGRLRSVLEVLASRVGNNSRPDWYDSSSKTVLDQADVLMTAQGPRELEQATAELLGAELYSLVHGEPQCGRLDLWIGEFVEAVKARIREKAGSPTAAWEGPLRLLHGLTSIGPRPLRMAAQDALRDVKHDLKRAAARRKQPAWLKLLPQVTATGDVWDMRDAYGTRLAVIARYRYPGGVDPSVFLFDIDACGFIRLVNAGVFDSVQEAAAAWRAQVGDTADGIEPKPVTTAQRLMCLVHYEHSEFSISGDETRAVMDNWFRAERRLRDLREALHSRGMPLPRAQSLYRDIDPEPMASAFTEWYAQRHGTEPDTEAVEAMAEEWLEGTLPETWHAISPHRAEFQRALISDWRPDDPITIAVLALLPTWVRWHGELSGLPEHLISRAVTVAEGQPRSPDSCPGQQP
jgi:hypothetical protein